MVDGNSKDVQSPDVALDKYYEGIDLDFTENGYTINGKFLTVYTSGFSNTMLNIVRISAKALLDYIKEQVELREKVRNANNKNNNNNNNMYIIELIDNYEILEETPIQHAYTTYDQLIKINGIIVTMSVPAIEEVQRYAVCYKCNNSIVLKNDKNPIPKCEKCHGKDEIVLNNSMVVKTVTETTTQLIIESHDYLSRVRCSISYDLLLKYNIKVGDYVSAIGYIDRKDEDQVFIILGIKKVNSIILNNESIKACINKIKSLTNTIGYEALYSELIRNFLSEIYGNYIIKEAILLCLASPISIDERLHIHILLVGDPALAKSTILSKVVRMIFNSTYVTGKGSTSVGLSATVVKDTKDRWTLNAGALVKSNKSVCCIDEFLTMEDEDMEILHEVMEQGTCSIAKANISTRLEARTRVIGATNPVYTIYDPYKSLFENVPLKESLLSRFDIIIVMRDTSSSNEDNELADFILDTTYYNGKFDKEFYRIYLNYLLFRYDHIPHLSNDAKEIIKKYYIDLRAEMRNSTTRTIYITHRTLATLKRLAIARARLLLKDVVDADDAKAVIEFYHKCIMTYSSNNQDPYTEYINKRNMFINILKPNIDENLSLIHI